MASPSGIFHDEEFRKLPSRIEQWRVLRKLDPEFDRLNTVDQFRVLREGLGSATTPEMKPSGAMRPMAPAASLDTPERRDRLNAAIDMVHGRRTELPTRKPPSFFDLLGTTTEGPEPGPMAADKRDWTPRVGADLDLELAPPPRQKPKTAAEKGAAFTAEHPYAARAIQGFQEGAAATIQPFAWLMEQKSGLRRLAPTLRGLQSQLEQSAKEIPEIPPLPESPTEADYLRQFGLYASKGAAEAAPQLALAGVAAQTMGARVGFGVLGAMQGAEQGLPEAMKGAAGGVAMGQFFKSIEPTAKWIAAPMMGAVGAKLSEYQGQPTMEKFVDFLEWFGLGLLHNQKLPLARRKEMFRDAVEEATARLPKQADAARKQLDELVERFTGVKTEAELIALQQLNPNKPFAARLIPEERPPLLREETEYVGTSPESGRMVGKLPDGTFEVISKDGLVESAGWATLEDAAQAAAGTGGAKTPPLSREIVRAEDGSFEAVDASGQVAKTGAATRTEAQQGERPVEAALGPQDVETGPRAREDYDVPQGTVGYKAEPISLPYTRIPFIEGADGLQYRVIGTEEFRKDPKTKEIYQRTLVEADNGRGPELVPTWVNVGKRKGAAGRFTKSPEEVGQEALRQTPNAVAARDAGIEVWTEPLTGAAVLETPEGLRIRWSDGRVDDWDGDLSQATDYIRSGAELEHRAEVRAKELEVDRYEAERLQNEELDLDTLKTRIETYLSKVDADAAELAENLGASPQAILRVLYDGVEDGLWERVPGSSAYMQKRSSVEAEAIAKEAEAEAASERAKDLERFKQQKKEWAEEVEKARQAAAEKRAEAEEARAKAPRSDPSEASPYNFSRPGNPAEWRPVGDRFTSPEDMPELLSEYLGRELEPTELNVIKEWIEAPAQFPKHMMDPSWVDLDFAFAIVADPKTFTGNIASAARARLRAYTSKEGLEAGEEGPERMSLPIGGGQPKTATRFYEGVALARRKPAKPTPGRAVALDPMEYVLWDGENMVATDGHRLHIDRDPYGMSEKEPGIYGIAKKGGEVEPLETTFDLGREADGLPQPPAPVTDFPPWQKVTEAFKFDASVPVAAPEQLAGDLQAAIRRYGFSESHTPIVSLPGAQAVNAIYLKDALLFVSGGKEPVSLDFSFKDGAFRLRSGSNEAIIMGVRNAGRATVGGKVIQDFERPDTFAVDWERYGVEPFKQPEAPPAKAEAPKTPKPEGKAKLLSKKELVELIKKNADQFEELIYGTSGKRGASKLPLYGVDTLRSAVTRVLGEEATRRKAEPKTRAQVAPAADGGARTVQRAGRQGRLFPIEDAPTPGERWVRPIVPGVENPEQPIPSKLRGTNDIFVRLAKALDIPVHLGSINIRRAHKKSKAIGTYTERTRSLSILKWGDVQSLSHEIGHYLADRYPREFASIYAKVRGAKRGGPTERELQELTAISYDVKQPIEGYAEAMRLWFTQPQKLYEVAPEVAKKLDWAIDSLPRNQRRAMKRARQDMQKFLDSSIIDVVADSYKPVTKGPSGPPGWDWQDTFRWNAVDRFHPLLQMERHLYGDPVKDGVWETMRLLSGNADRVSALVHKGVIQWDRSKKEFFFTGKPVKEIFKNIWYSKRKTDEFATYYFARKGLSLIDTRVGRSGRVIRPEEIENAPPNTAEAHKEFVDSRAYARQLYTDEVKATLKKMRRLEKRIAKSEDPDLLMDKIEELRRGAVEEWEFAEEARKEAQAAFELARLRDDYKAGQSRFQKFSREQLEQGMRLERPEYRQAYNELIAFHRQVADFGEQMGLWNAEGRKRWEDGEYAGALYRQFYEGGSRYAGSPLQIQPGIFKKRHSQRPFKDPISQILEGPTRIINMALQNQVKLKLMDMASTPGGGMYVERVGPGVSKNIVPVQQILSGVKAELMKIYGTQEAMDKALGPDFLENFGNVDFLVQYMGGVKPYGERVIGALKNGKAVYAQVHDPQVFGALENMRPESMDAIVRVMNAVRRFSQGVYTLEPGFMLYRNPVRDAIHATTVTRYGMQHFTEALKMLKPIILREPLYWEAIANGMGGSTKYEGKADHEKAIRRFAGKHNIANLILRPTDMARALAAVRPIRAMGEVGRTMELMSRLAEYNKAVKAGETKTHAAFLGREISVDFGQFGQNALLSNFLRTIPFANTTIQGADNYYRKLVWEKDLRQFGPFELQQRTAVATRMAIYAGLSASLALANRDKEWFKKSPMWVRLAYDQIELGKDADGRTIIGHLPKAFEPGLYANLITLSIEHLLGQAEPERQLGAELGQALLLAWGISEPALVSPLLEQALNYNTFTHQPLVPESYERLPAHLQARPTTPLMFREMGRQMADLGLGDKWYASPLRLEAAYRSIFGPLMWWMVLATANADDQGVAFRWDEYPGVRGLLRSEDRYDKNTGIFYDNLGRLNELHNAFMYLRKTGDVEELQRYAEMQEPGMYKLHGKVQDIVGMLRFSLNQIQSGNMDSELKGPGTIKEKRRRAADQIIKQMRALQGTAVEAYRESQREGER